MRRYEPLTVEDDDGVEHEIPTRWAICRLCRGEGKHSLAVDGHGITQEEWDRDYDDEMRATYLAGGYDQPCAPCAGTGKVREPDLQMMAPALRKLLQRQERELAECAAIERAERMMGA